MAHGRSGDRYPGRPKVWMETFTPPVLGKEMLALEVVFERPTSSPTKRWPFSLSRLYQARMKRLKMGRFTVH